MEPSVKRTHKGALSVLLFILTTLVSVCVGYWKNWEIVNLISNTIFILIGCCLVLFLHAFSAEKELYDYDNKSHFGRFVLLWMLSMGVAVVCSFLPVSGWPFLAVYLGFALFTNMPIGITAGSVILLMTVLFSGEGIVAFLLYFMCGIVCISMFQKLDHNYKIGVPLLVSILCLIVGLTAAVVLYTNEKLNLEMFLIPFINVFISLVLMIAVLKIFSSAYIYRYHLKYLEINDQVFPLLANWKEKDKANYFHAIHTAYFCDRIATKLVVDAPATKAAGYYFHISGLSGAENWEETAKICLENEFPPAVYDILRELLDKGTPVTSKEAGIVILCDAIISAVYYLFKTNPDPNPDYDKLVDTVFENKLESGILSRCQLTLEELSITKRAFKEEKIYYDFLR